MTLRLGLNLGFQVRPFDEAFQRVGWKVRFGFWVMFFLFFCLVLLDLFLSLRALILPAFYLRLVVAF